MQNRINATIFVPMTSKRMSRAIFQVALPEKWKDLRDFIVKESKETRQPISSVMRTLMFERMQQKKQEKG